MLLEIAAVQATVFIIFALSESILPNRVFNRPPLFAIWWGAVLLFSLVWMRAYIYLWPDIPSLMAVEGNPVLIGALFYLLYSFGNYWIHRLKHSNRFLWKYVHRLHHSAPHMETGIAFFRHPVEIAANSIYLIFLGKFVFGLSIDAICVCLAIEGSLECFHHSNIKTPKKIRWIYRFVQIPEMHLVHHEFGSHSGNYSPFLWDYVFDTAVLPEAWDKDLGFKNSNDIWGYLMLRN